MKPEYDVSAVYDSPFGVEQGKLGAFLLRLAVICLKLMELGWLKRAGLKLER
jgi:hypothetical protein